MEQKEFLDLLGSPRLEERRRALESGYKVRAEAEVKAVARAAMVVQPALQRAALQAINETPTKVAAPLLRQLAVHGREPDVRREAVQRLSDLKDDETTETLLACAQDEHVDVQVVAIQALGSRKHPEITPLLLDRLKTPEAAERVRKSAAEALGKQADDAFIAPLIAGALCYRQSRPEIFGALRAIGKVKVANALVDVILNGSPEGLPTPDDDFRLHAVRTIAVKPPRRGKPLKRYREVLHQLYTAQMRRGRNINTEVAQELVRTFDDTTGEHMVNHLQQFAVQPELAAVADMTVAMLHQVQLSTALPFWMKLLDMPQEYVRQRVSGPLAEVAQEDLPVFAEGMREAMIAEGIRHQNNRLPEVVRQVGVSVVPALTSALLPLFEQRDEGIQNRARQYLHLCRRLIVGREGWSGWLESVLTYYRDHSRARDALLAFFNELRDQVGGGNRVVLWTHLLDGASTSEPLAVLFENLVAQAPNPQELLREILGRITDEDAEAAWWLSARKVLEAAPEEARHAALTERLQAVWHSKMIDYLVEDRAPQTRDVCRLILQSGDYQLPARSRPKVIRYLGGAGSAEDVPLLIQELKSEDSKVRVAAAKALGNIGGSDAELTLCKTLRDPTTAVVRAAIKGLRHGARPGVHTVRQLEERSVRESEPKRDIREEALKALESLLERHLRRDPMEEDIDSWLTTLQAFGRCDCADQLARLLNEVEDPTLRAKGATTIGVCCEPEAGLAVIEQRLTTEPIERDPEVRRALEAAVDELRGSPDIALLGLLSEVIEAKFDREALLGPYRFEDLFTQANTVALLRHHLPKVLEAKRDPDTFVTRLDGIADVLGDEVEAALVRADPSSAAPGKRGYHSQIDFLGRASVPLKRAARALHDLRQKSDLAHLVDETSGQPKEGCDAQDQTDARKHFQVIVEETVKFLRQDYEARKETQATGDS